MNAHNWSQNEIDEYIERINNAPVCTESELEGPLNSNPHIRNMKIIYRCLRLAVKRLTWDVANRSQNDRTDLTRSVKYYANKLWLYKHGFKTKKEYHQYIINLWDKHEKRLGLGECPFAIRK